MSPGSEKRLVLLVDDNAVFQQMIQDLADQKGWALEKADDVSSGKKLVEAHLARADVLLLDMVLPSGNGLEILKTIRALGDEGAALPAVVLSGAEPDEEGKKELAALQAAHLDKGKTIEFLGPMLEDLFGRLPQRGA